MKNALLLLTLLFSLTIVAQEKAGSTVAERLERLENRLYTTNYNFNVDIRRLEGELEKLRSEMGNSTPGTRNTPDTSQVAYQKLERQIEILKNQMDTVSANAGEPAMNANQGVNNPNQAMIMGLPRRVAIVVGVVLLIALILIIISIATTQSAVRKVKQREAEIRKLMDSKGWTEFHDKLVKEIGNRYKAGNRQ